MLYCPECDGEGVGILEGEYVTCEYCGGTGRNYEMEAVLWESYYEPDDKQRLIEQEEWYYHEHHGHSF